jgi:hypothetical protein
VLDLRMAGLVRTQATNLGGARMTENKKYIEAMRALRRSNAAQPHKDKRTKRKRTRKAKKLFHINDNKED